MTSTSINPAGAATASDLLAALGNAVGQANGQTSGLGNGPRGDAGCAADFLALVEQALGAQDQAPTAAAAPSSPEAVPQVSPTCGTALPTGSREVEPAKPPAVDDVEPAGPSDSEPVDTDSDVPADLPVLTAPMPLPITPDHGRGLGKLAGPADPKASAPGERGRALGRVESANPPAPGAPPAPTPTPAPVPALGAEAAAEAARTPRVVSISATSGDEVTAKLDGARHVLPRDTEHSPSATQPSAATPTPAGVAAGGPEVGGSTTLLPTSAAPTTAPVATTPTDAPRTTSTPNPVLPQVVDKVTSLLSRGNGTHRISLTLTPDSLGEVRVVMSVRDGAVQVRLAASQHETRALLADGSSELHRLLGLSGATDTKVVVRELGNGVQVHQSTASPPAGQQSTPDGSQQNAWNGTATDPRSADGRWGRPTDQHAGTRAHHLATDGTTNPGRATVTGTTALRSSESVAPGRHRGLDVTM